VVTDLWDASFENNMAHIELTRGVDAIVVAPATADFLAKIANGICDDLLTTTCIARACPLLVAPAMNVEMWENAATQRNVATLRADGVTLLGPAAGDQACGEVGMGRMLEPDEILQGVLSFLAPKKLAGRKVIVTAGPTFEAIDTVRGITNLSSGRWATPSPKPPPRWARMSRSSADPPHWRLPRPRISSTSPAPPRWPTR
jgi:phosphopantothenoylcysteine decarboxylase/phosphopantothenate--cysteine ligase